MSDPKDFLSRWSQRKLKPEAEKSAPEEKTPSPAGTKAVAAPEPEFDITSLPSLESIGANSDVAAFLQRGVPVNLTRAALRRAWSADPAIRDFVGLSENSWDFNAPDSIPGFGSLDADEVRQVAARFFGELAETTAEAPAAESNKSEETGSATEQLESEHQAEPPAESAVDQQQPDAAMQHRHQVAFCDSSLPPPKRHGRALPK